MRCKLYTHTDLDGVGCAILAYLAFDRENVDVEYCDYKDVDERVVEFVENGELFSSYDKVFITDISISEETALFVGLRDVPPRKIRLFDHHATALGLNKYEWCEVRVEDMLTGIKTCGTEMFFCYLVGCECFPGFGRSKFSNLARFVGIVRDYDTWRWKELGDEGIICKQVNDLFGIYGRDVFIDWVIQRINYPRVFPYFPSLDEQDHALLEYKQKDIDIYIEQKNKQLQIYQDSCGRFVGVVFAERYISELGNRICEMHPEIDYVALVNLGAGVVSFRTCRDDVDLGTEIAHSLGGGGHKKAAGAEFGSEIADEVVRKLFGSGEGVDTYA